MLRAAIDAAAADRLSSTTILKAAGGKLNRYASGDPLTKRNACSMAAGIESTVRAMNVQEAADASAAVIPAAQTAAQAPVIALYALATAAGSTVKRVTHPAGVMEKAHVDIHPDRLARIGRAAAEAVYAAAIGPAHEAMLAI